MTAKILVAPVDSVEAHCAAVALQRAGIAATTDPEPDVKAIVEFLVPGGRPQDAASLIADGVDRPLLLVAPEADGRWLRLARKLRADGLVARRCTTEALLEAVEQLLRGESALAEPSSTDADPLDGLTVRELEIMALLKEGASNKAIASALGISYHTARTHVFNLMEKLGVSHRYAAAALSMVGGP